MPTNIVRRLLALLGIVAVLATLIVLTLLVVSFVRGEMAESAAPPTISNHPKDYL